MLVQYFITGYYLLMLLFLPLLFGGVFALVEIFFIELLLILHHAWSNKNEQDIVLPA